MEAGRVLSRYPLDFTVRFVAFTAEEIGLVGSKVYAQDVRSRGEKIIGVINLDMIAYAERCPKIWRSSAIPHRPGSSAKFAAVAGDYGLIATGRIIDASIDLLRPLAFLGPGLFGRPAPSRMTPLINPEYHKTTDTIDTLNFEFYAQASRAALATLAELAQPVRPATRRRPPASPPLRIATFPCSARSGTTS